MPKNRVIKTSAASLQIIADHLRHVSKRDKVGGEIKDAVIALESVVADLLIVEHPRY